MPARPIFVSRPRRGGNNIIRALVQKMFQEQQQPPPVVAEAVAQTDVKRFIMNPLEPDPLQAVAKDKSAARASFKQALGVKRLPPGTVIEEAASLTSHIFTTH